VLQYRNQKLVQQLEAQKVEYSAFESKFHQLEEKQTNYDDTLGVISASWERVSDFLCHLIIYVYVYMCVCVCVCVCVCQFVCVLCNPLYCFEQEFSHVLTANG